jgi:hypothetical protein
MDTDRQASAIFVVLIQLGLQLASSIGRASSSEYANMNYYEVLGLQLFGLVYIKYLPPRATSSSPADPPRQKSMCVMENGLSEITNPAPSLCHLP